MCTIKNNLYAKDDNIIHTFHTSEVPNELLLDWSHCWGASKVRNGVEFLWGDTYYGIYLYLGTQSTLNP